jgi:hypothetical protein
VRLCDGLAGRRDEPWRCGNGSLNLCAIAAWPGVRAGAGGAAAQCQCGSGQVARRLQGRNVMCGASTVPTAVTAGVRDAQTYPIGGLESCWISGAEGCCYRQPPVSDRSPTAGRCDVTLGERHDNDCPNLALPPCVVVAAQRVAPQLQDLLQAEGIPIRRCRCGPGARRR